MSETEKQVPDDAHYKLSLPGVGAIEIRGTDAFVQRHMEAASAVFGAELKRLRDKAIAKDGTADVFDANLRSELERVESELAAQLEAAKQA